MHTILFYKDSQGNEPVKTYICQLKEHNTKDSRIKLNKISDYLTLLSRNGTSIGQPYVKHLQGELWELRPLRDRIFFVAWIDGSYVLLHHFVKKTQKTPAREIKQALKEIEELKKRG